MKKMYIYFALVALFLIILTIVITSGSTENIGNPKVKDILKNNPDADLIKLDELIYQNFAFDMKEEQEYSKGHQIGKIRKKTNAAWWFGNLYATKLPKGTKVYTTDSNGYNKGDAPIVIVVDLNNEIIVYHALIEG